LKGRLDAERYSTVLVVPIFEPEFSGNETVEKFKTLRGGVVPANRWDRSVHPNIRLRFDNQSSASGTGDDYVFVTFQQLIFEVSNIMGVANGFVEVLNYKDAVIEVVYAQDDLYSVIHDRDDNSAVYAHSMKLPMLYGRCLMTDRPVKDKEWSIDGPMPTHLTSRC
jgi:hypothetical protein